MLCENNISKHIKLMFILCGTIIFGDSRGTVWRKIKLTVAVATEGKETPTLTTVQRVSHENEVGSQENPSHTSPVGEHTGST